jgi:hypothetical protein
MNGFLKRILLLAAIYLCCSTHSFAQKWEKNFGQDSAETATFIRQTLDGGFIICGTSGNVVNDLQVYVLRLDQFGKKIWDYKYGDESIENGHAILEMEDGGFMVLASRDIAGFKNAYVMKLDAFGKKKWEKGINILGFNLNILTMSKTTDGFVIMGTNVVNANDSKIKLVKIDFDGNVLFENNFGATDNFNVGTDLEGLENGGFVITGSSLNPNTLAFRVLLAKLDKNANVIFSKVYESFNFGVVRDIKPTLDKGFIMCGESRFAADRKIFVLKVDSNGVKEWSRFYVGLGKSEGYHVEPQSDGYILGCNSTSSNTTGQILLIKINFDGQVISTKELGDVKIERARSFQQLSDGGFAIAGYSNESTVGPTDVYVFRTNDLGETYNDKLYGKVYADINKDCLPNASDYNLEGWIVTAKGANGTFFAETDKNGNYDMLIDTGTFEVTINIDQHPSWKMSCDSVQIVVFGETHMSKAIVFAAKPNENCNELFVDLGVPKLERCNPARYTVNYANKSGNDVAGAFVEIELDPYLDYTSSSIPFNVQNGKVYSFPLGNIEAQSSGTFYIDVIVDCDSTIDGEAYFVKAHIFPDNVCLPVTYLGPDIEVSGQCTGDSIKFRIKNIKGPMGGPKGGIVIQDEVIRQAFDFQLGAGEETIIAVPAGDGKTFRLEVEEDDALPELLGDETASYVLEGCQANRTLGFNTGFVTLFPQDDETDFIAIDYKESVLSTANQRQIAQPVGYDPERFILPNSYIDYTVFFENEFNDSIKQIEILDSLSPFLDISTFKMGSYSSGLSFELHDNGVLKVVFDNINLKGASSPVLERSAFFKFRIRVKENVPNGTKIYNRANVFFDYTRAVVTNQVFHTVGKDFVRIALFVPKPNTLLSAKLYPNPMRNEAILFLDKFDGDGFDLEIYDLNGRLVMQKRGTNKQTIIKREDLSAGFYIFNIKEDGVLLGNGKIIVE